MTTASHQISAVQRKLGTRVLEAGEARVLTISQTYDTDIEDLWDACTTIERIPRWLMPISGDLRLGGKYQLTGNAGGVVESCDKPNAFGATWEFGGEVSWIDVRFTAESATRTKLEIAHIAHVDDERWGQYGPGAVGIGWDSMLYGLALHLSTGEAVDPNWAMEWMGSDDGKQFMAASSEAWREASVAAGTPEAEARAAADAVFAAYTATE